MVRQLLNASVTGIAGSIIGGVLGILAGVAVAALLGFAIPRAIGTENWPAFALLFGGPIGALAGLVAGAGTGVMGARTRSGLDWAFISGAGTALGPLTASHWSWTGIAVVAIVAAIAGCFSVYAARRLLAKRLLRGPLKAWVFLGYFLSLIVIARVAGNLLPAIAGLF
jgi:hypothetical protein